MSLAFTFARRELRAGLTGLTVFLICLALGVAAIAAIGTTRAAINGALTAQGAVLLGGDAEMRFTYRAADADERAFFDTAATEVSEVFDFRSMAVTSADDPERALTQILAVDTAYPLLGALTLDPPISVADALAIPQTGPPGAVMERVLAERLGLTPGDTFLFGTKEVRLTAFLLAYPDSPAAGFSLGPRSIILREGLDGSGLLGEGTLFESRYRMLLPPDTDLETLEIQAETAFPDTRWRDARNGTPTISRFVTRLGNFLILLGLAGLAVGGVGIANAVRGHLDRKTATIAVFRSLGASRSLILWIYGLQIAAIAVLGIALGLLIGAGLPLLFAPLIEASLPLPVELRLYPAPLFEAALYGALTAAIFSLWPLAQSERIRPAALFRDASLGASNIPRLPYLIATAVLLAALTGAAVWFSGRVGLTLFTLGGIVAALGALTLAALAVRWMAKRLARRRSPPALRLALASIGGPGSAVTATVLSIGLGLTVLATIGQIDGSIRNDITTRLPDVAPSYFILDIQPDQIDGVIARFEGDDGVSEYRTAPMLRGIITEIDGRPASEVAGPHWVLRGDRGVTYAATSEGSTITEGTFWEADHDGPPQISFAAEEAEEMDLSLGDMMTVEILGRPITGEITSFREVDFSNAGMGFILAMPPNALLGAPHTHIATVNAAPEAEAAILRDLAGAYPNITAVRVRDAIDRAAEFLGAVATATRWGAAASLVTGLFVLIGTAAARARAQSTEAAILKTLGATRATVLGSFLIRAGLMGLAAGLVALMAGSLGAWAVMRFVMETEYTLLWGPALVVVALGIGVTLISGAIFARSALASRPAGILRAQE